MPELRVEKRGGPQPPSRGRIVIPLWPILLLVLVVVGVAFAWWPRHATRFAADFDPVGQQQQVLAYHGEQWVPVGDAVHHQVILPDAQMRVVGKSQGHTLYQSAEGGGGGAPGRLYVRSGNHLFVPLEPRTTRP